MALSTSLLIGLADGTNRPWLDEHAAGEVEQERVEADGVADAAEDDDLGNVEEPLAAATEVPGGPSWRSTLR
jgi:hypothetical protein